MRTLMAIAGHANMSTTQRYIDMRPSVIRGAVELWSWFSFSYQPHEFLSKNYFCLIYFEAHLYF